GRSRSSCPSPSSWARSSPASRASTCPSRRRSTRSSSSSTATWTTCPSRRSSTSVALRACARRPRPCPRRVRPAVALQVELVSPERILYSGEADMVVCRTEGGGEIAFLTGHAPFLGALTIAQVKVVPPEGRAQPQLAAVHGGLVEVRDNRVIILSDVAELAAEIDVERARRSLTEA